MCLMARSRPCGLGAGDAVVAQEAQHDPFAAFPFAAGIDRQRAAEQRRCQQAVVESFQRAPESNSAWFASSVALSGPWMTRLS